MDIIEAAIEKIQNELSSVQMIYQFGSVGSEFETRDSDLDLAVLADKALDPVQLWNLAEALALDIGKDVDLIDLASVPIVFRFKIIESGKRIYCKDESFCESFASLTYTMYINFNERRQGILDDIEKRGTIR